MEKNTTTERFKKNLKELTASEVIFVLNIAELLKSGCVDLLSLEDRIPELLLIDKDSLKKHENG